MSVKEALAAISLKVKILIVCAAVVVAGGVSAAVLISSNKADTYRVLKVFELTGSAVISREGTGELDAYVGMNLESGDTLTVGEDSTLRISMDGDKYVLLDSGTVLELVAEGTPADSRTSIVLKQGTILNELTTSLSANSSYEVSTPKATMAVRGTSFIVSVEQNEDGSYTIRTDTLHGKVEVILLGADGNPTGESAMVPEGKCIVIKTVPDPETGNPAEVDGTSFFVYENEKGVFVEVPKGSDPVTEIVYEFISAVVREYACRSNDDGTMVLEDYIIRKLRESISGEAASEPTVTDVTTTVASETTVTSAPEDEDTIVTTTPPQNEEDIVITTTVPPAREEDIVITTTVPPAREEDIVVTTTPPVRDEDIAITTTAPTIAEDKPSSVTTTTAPMTDSKTEATTVPETEHETRITTTPFRGQENNNIVTTASHVTTWTAPTTTTAPASESKPTTTTTVPEESGEESSTTTVPVSESESATTTTVPEESEEETTTTTTTVPEESEEETTTTTTPVSEEESETTTTTTAVEMCTVSFKCGDSVIDVQVEKGSTVSAADIPEIEELTGFTSKWVYNGEEEFTDEIIVTEDIIVTAKYTEKTSYTVTYVLGADETVVLKTQSVYDGDSPEAVSLDTVVTDSSGNKYYLMNWTSPTDKITENTTISVTEYEDYDSVLEVKITDYGGEVTHFLAVLDKDSITLPDSAAAYDGYTFIGWGTVGSGGYADSSVKEGSTDSEDSSGYDYTIRDYVDYQPGQTITITNGMRMYGEIDGEWKYNNIKFVAIYSNSVQSDSNDDSGPVGENGSSADSADSSPPENDVNNVNEDSSG